MLEKTCHRFLCVALWVVVSGVGIESTAAQEWGLAVYGGQLTKETWERSIFPGAEFADAALFVVAGTSRFAKFWSGRLSLEIEAQVGKYIGDQDHWEFNLPLFGLRWHRFPWDHWLATSFAYGIGLSYATQIPEIELETNDESSRWLIYWFGELTFAKPTAAWEFLLRLHHRSDGFGTMAEDGGSNALCAGLRLFF
ncbi:hypothetical protein Dvar_71090 [Desulfosarcina variabilis str. Montpellier]|uniref:hypothetical protein n=1 Tax=Desulfosarcina variabilis TaxID=2300 RepID=UPI003AFB178B